MQKFSPTSVSCQIGNLDITIESGLLANQASGAVTISSQGTVVLVTAVRQTLDTPRGFFPLTCNYQEMMYACGRIPGSFFRREGRPSEHETLVSRLIDRPIRPLFPESYDFDELQIIATVLSVGSEVDPDVLAVTGASAALHISDIPFLGPIAGIRVGRIDEQFIAYPVHQGVSIPGDLNLVLAASNNAVVMVEGGAEFLSEDIMAEAIAFGHEAIQPLLTAQNELREKIGKPKIAVPEATPDTELENYVTELISEDLKIALSTAEKVARKQAKQTAAEKTKIAVAEKWPEDEEKLAALSGILKNIEKNIVRRRIVNEGLRIDGRNTTTVRPLDIQVAPLPRTHGSAFFRRGETSALGVCTLGSSRDMQRIESLFGDSEKRWILHYNFPPYCVGESRMLRGTSRREVGHGALAERAIAPVLPPESEFPFTIRMVSEIMESNGSSSMASVCVGTLALMDAGVPITAPVAGIAMGLCKEDDEYYVLTDILGDEDALGDMDFKVAGTREGITAIQMDIKIAGIPTEILTRALLQARDARLHILDAMQNKLPAHRTKLSEFAPQIEVVQINPEKIRAVIGPGGKNIKAITAASGADIDLEDSGRVSIFAPSAAAMAQAKEMVLYYDQTPVPGKNYVGVVRKILDGIGAIVEILPGAEGMLHISQMDVGHVQKVEDLLQLGQEVTVKVIELEANGRIRLSRKAWLMEQAGQEVDIEAFKRPPMTRRPQHRD